MTRRTRKAYRSAFAYIHENLISLNGMAIITDFEQAMRQGVNDVVPHIRVLGCWFHHCQALRRMAASIPTLFELIKKNENAKAFLRQFQCLALLPANLIEKEFINLSRSVLSEFPQFTRFVAYYKEQWIKRVKPENFSVFLQDTRTTASAEAYNGKSNKVFKTHGNFFSFIEALQAEELMKTEELEHDTEGAIQHDFQKKKDRIRAKNIQKYSLMLQNGKISAKLFIKTMANINNKIIYEDKAISLHPAEIEITKETELFCGPEQSSQNDPCVLQNQMLNDDDTVDIINKSQLSESLDISIVASEDRWSAGIPSLNLLI